MIDTTFIMSITDYPEEQAEEQYVHSKLHELSNAGLIQKIAIVSPHPREITSAVRDKIDQFHATARSAGLVPVHGERLTHTDWPPPVVGDTSIYPPTPDDAWLSDYTAVRLREIKAEAAKRGCESLVYTEPHGRDFGDWQSGPWGWLKHGLDVQQGQRIADAMTRAVALSGPCDYSTPAPSKDALSPGLWHYGNAMHHLGAVPLSYSSYRHRPAAAIFPQLASWTFAPFCKPVVTWAWGYEVSDQLDGEPLPVWLADEFVARDPNAPSAYAGVTDAFWFTAPGNRIATIDAVLAAAA